MGTWSEPTGSDEAAAILVVEDDEAVLKLMRLVLLELGYGVAIASGPAEALRHFRQASQLPALVISDVVMPGMSGPEMVRRMLAQRPDLQVLFMTGHIDAAAVDEVALSTFSLLRKPFYPAELSGSVQRILGEHRQFAAAAMA